MEVEIGDPKPRVNQPINDFKALSFTVYNCPRKCENLTNLPLFTVRCLLFDAWYSNCREKRLGSKLNILLN